MNNNLVMVCGKPASGKSASLMNLKNQDGVLYLNCENNKRLPFKNSFTQVTVTDPYDVFSAFDQAEEAGDTIHTIVIDTFTFLMEMFETKYVIPHAGTSKGMTAWGDYAQFGKTLFSDKVNNSTKNVIILAHTSDVLNEDSGILESMVQVKGSLMKLGIEAFFSTVVTAKCVPLKELKGSESDLLNVDEDNELDGFKHVFQTLRTKKSVGERMRAPLKMWSRKETFIDNDCQSVISRLHEYYGDE